VASEGGGEQFEPKGNKAPRFEQSSLEAPESHLAAEVSEEAVAARMILIIVIGGIILNMSTKGTIGVFETLGGEIALTKLGWSSSQTGFTFTSFGAIGVIFLLNFAYLVGFFGDFNLMLFGMFLMLISCFLLIPISNSLSSWQFYLSLVLMYSLGYPIGHTALLGLYSKIVKKGPQALMMGVFAAAGSVARIVFPLLAGYLSEIYNTESAIFFLMSIILFFSFTISFYFREKINTLLIS